MEKRAEAKLAKMQQELELSAFLNKGILQSNQEYKVRIAELETENAVLRTCESKLAALEEAYSEQEKLGRRREDAFASAKRRAEAAKREAGEEGMARALAEAEAKRWRGKYERLRAAVAQAQSLFEDAEAGEPTPRPSSRGETPLRERGFTLALPGPGPSTMRNARTAPAAAVPALASPDTSSPTARASSLRAQKRLRPLPAAGDGDGSEAAGADTTPVPVRDAQQVLPSSAKEHKSEPKKTTRKGKEKETDVDEAQKGNGKPRRRRRTGEGDGDHIEDEDFAPPPGNGSATIPSKRRRGRHSSPLRRPKLPSPLLPATAPRMTRSSRREPLAPIGGESFARAEGAEREGSGETEVKSEVDSDPGSDRDPLAQWDDL